jgi:hypothetical protein
MRDVFVLPQCSQLTFSSVSILRVKWFVTREQSAHLNS